MNQNNKTIPRITNTFFLIWLKVIIIISFFSPHSIGSIVETRVSVEPMPSILGKLSIDHTGAANYSISQLVPKTVDGLQPELSLKYNSRKGNGLLGLGWYLDGLSSITRCDMTIEKDGFIDGVDFDDNDKFCLDGKRLVAINGVYGADGSEYRIENDNNSQIFSYGYQASGPQWFEVKTSSGRIAHYGRSVDSRVEAQGKADVTIWSIFSDEDADGNMMTFNYMEDNVNGEFLLESIQYGMNKNIAESEYFGSVDFEYESRGDNKKSFVHGTDTNMTKRLSSIIHYTNEQITFSYQFNYLNKNWLGKSRLDNIQYCEMNNQCIENISFDWFKDEFKYNKKEGIKTSITADIATAGIDLARIKYGDFNGDGLTDIYLVNGWDTKPIRDSVYLSNDDGTYKLIDGINTPVHPTLEAAPNAINRIKFGDFNGDGKTDIYYVTGWGTTSTEDNIYLSNGKGEYEQVAGINTSIHPTNEAATNDLNRIKFGDFNGDGKTDIYYIHGWSTTPVQDIIYLSKGNGEYEQVAGINTSIHPTIEAAPNDLNRIKFGDFNGDGKTDIYYIHGWSTTPVQDIIYLSKGNGEYEQVAGINTSIHPTIKAAPNDLNRIKFGDFNGDGKTDIYNITGWGTTPTQDHVYLSKGNGAYEQIAGINTSIHPTIEAAPNDLNRIKFGDFNGDGKTDIYNITGWGTTPTQDHIYLSKGNGQYEQVSGINTSVHPTIKAAPNDLNRIRFGDFNGDSKSDIYYVTGWGKSNTIDDVYIQTQLDANIKTIIESDKVQKQLTYSWLSDDSIYKKGYDATYPIQDYHGPLNVVSSVKTINSKNEVQEDNQYNYGEGKLHLHGLGFLGFKWIKVQDDVSGVYTKTEYLLDPPLVGRVLSEEKYDYKYGKRRKISSLKNEYSQYDHDNSITSPYLSKSTQTVYPATDQSSEDDSDEVITVTTYDISGEVIEEVVIRNNDNEQLELALTGFNSVDNFGAFNYRVPIILPKGSNGLNPELAFKYNSQSGNGPFGIGWSLGGLSAITRCGTTLEQDGFIDGIDFDDNDKYCLDGKRLVAIKGEYGKDGTEYRIENDNSTVIYSRGQLTSGPKWFEMHTASGQTMQFGQNDNSRIQTNDSSDTLTWKINQLQDLTLNKIAYHYDKNSDSNEHLISEIRYDFDGKGNFNSNIVFNYDPRNHTKSYYIGGIKFGISKLLTSVEFNTDQSNQNNHKYTFSYQDKKSVKSNLIEISLCDDKNVCAINSDFDWSHAENGYEEPKLWTVAQPNANLNFTSIKSNNGTYKREYLRYIDINNDGLVDRVYHYNYEIGKHGVWVELNNGSGFDSAVAWSDPAPNSEQNLVEWGDQNSTFSTYFDINADGLPDRINHRNYKTNQAGLWVALNNGTSFEPVEKWDYPVGNNGQYYPAWRGNGSTYSQFIDINGDNLPDRVNHHNYITDEPGMWVALNTGAGFESIRKWDYPVGNNGQYYPLWGGKDNVYSQFVDINADGLPDRVNHHNYITDEPGMWVALNTGNGFEPIKKWDYPIGNNGQYNPLWAGKSNVYSQFIDINDDGLPDRVNHHNYITGEAGMWVALNTGTGLEPVSKWEYPVGNNGQFNPSWAASGNVYSQFIDLNADGLPDRVNHHNYVTSQKGLWAQYNNGSGFEPMIKIKDVVLNASQHLPTWASTSRTIYTDQLSTFVDINGDGIPDRINHKNFATGQVGVWVELGKQSPAHITKISTNTNETQIDYQPISNNSIYEKGTQAKYPIQDYAGSLQVVSSIKVTNTEQLVQLDNQFRYGGGKMHLRGFGFLGFEWIEVADNMTDQFTQSTYSQEIPLIGKILSEQKYYYKNAIRYEVSSKTNEYSEHDHGNGITSTYLSATNETNFQFNNSLITEDTFDAITTTTKYDAANQVIAEEQTQDTHTVIKDSSSDSTQIFKGTVSIGNTGAVSYTVPVSVPVGVAGLQPELSLNYNSNGGNGPLGIGWSLGGLTAITRCGTTLEQDGFIDGVDFDDNDKFCLDGKRLVAIYGEYGQDGTEYRTENDNSSRIISHGLNANGPLWFEAHTKSGQTLQYGNTEDSRIEAQGKNEVIVWSVSMIEDMNGNQMTVSYIEDNVNGKFLPLSIQYGKNKHQAGSTDFAKVIFEYNARSDISEGYFLGSISKQTKLLSNIITYSANQKVDSLNLEYDDNSNGLILQSKLIKVERCQVNNECAQPITFQWSQNKNQSFTDFKIWTSVYGGSGWTSAERYSTINNPDLNGDGLPDICGRASSGIYCGLNNGKSFGEFKYWTRSYGGGWSHPSHYATITYPDLNGDGLPDICGRGGSGMYCGINNGSSFTNIKRWTTAYGGAWSHPSHYATLSYPDLNGDGLPDICGRGGLGMYCGINNGSAFTSIKRWTSSYGGSWSHPSHYSTLSYPDLNGDGLPDICGRGGLGMYCGINNGSAFTSIKRWTTAYGGSWSHPSHYSTLSYPDLNADGLPDICGRAGLGMYCGLNNGKAFSKFKYWTRSYGGSWSHPSHYSTISYDDLNGDGLPDICGRGGLGMYCGINNGSAFTSIKRWTSAYGSNWTNHASHYATIRTIDLNGDGLLDICGRASAGMYCGIQKSQIDHQLESITVGEEQTGFTYTALTDSSIYQKGTDSVYPVQDIQAPMYVVSSVRSSDDFGGFSEKTYAYGGARMHMRGRGFLGFAWMNVRDEQTGIYTTTEYNQNYPYIGQIDYSRSYIVKDRGEINLSELDNTWVTQDFYNGDIRVPYTSKSIAKAYEVNDGVGNTAISVITKEHEFDDYANLTQVKISNQSQSETRIKQLNNSYDNDTTQWHLGMLYCSTVTSNAPNVPSITRTSGFAYNSIGLLIKEVIEPKDGDVAGHCVSSSGESDITTIRQYEYDSYGNQIAMSILAQGVEARNTTTQWSENGRFSVASTNALGHREQRSYDSRLGVVISVTDPNGLRSTWEYDNWTRLITKNHANGTKMVSVFKFCPQTKYHCPENARHLQASQSTGGILSVTYFDSLGREIRKQSESFNGEQIFVDTDYYAVADGGHAYGKIKRQSRPYFKGDKIHWKLKSYDVVGRDIKEIRPDGSIIHIQHEAFKITQIDPFGRVSSKLSDGLGGLKLVTDALGGQIHYQRDAVGNLISTTVTGPDQTNPITTHLRYDQRGRKIAMNDPNMGEWTYQYNALGELISQTDAKAQTSYISYDRLGRMIQRIEAEDTTNWTFDSADGAGLGKLYLVENSNGYRAHTSYDKFGRTIETTQHIAGANFTTQTIYDAIGRVDKIIYPSGHEVQHHYSANSMLIAVSSPTAGETYWQLKAQNALGNITKESFGNGLTTNRSFSSTTGVVEWIKTGKSAKPAQTQDLTYLFDEVGNLVERNDQRMDRIERFEYDPLYRLTSASVSGHTDPQISKYFNYDAHGNIVYKSDVGDYLYGQGITVNDAGPHAVTQVGNNNYQYDANGNLINVNQTNVDSKLIQWSSFNKPIRITRNSSAGIAESSFIYGPSRSRIVHVKTKTNSEQITIRYVGSLYEQHDEVGIIKRVHYIKANGRTAIYTTTDQGLEKTRYLHKDHLGSVDVITDEAGDIVERNSFDAWGKRRENNWQDALGDIIPFETSRGFSDHEQLDEVGLIHMNGRVYDPEIGRFLSADPFVQRPDATQNFNRYSYVNNNPLSYTDPSGFFFKSLFKAVKSIVKNHFKTELNHIKGIFGGPKAYLGAGFGFLLNIQRTHLQIAVPFVDADSIMRNPYFQQANIIAATAVCAAFTGGSAGPGCAAGMSSAYAYYNTGSVGAALRTGAITYATSYLTQEIDVAKLGNFRTAVAHGVVGGVTSELQGGSFLKGFAISFGMNSLKSMAFEMRKAMIENSKLHMIEDHHGNLHKLPNNLAGESASWFGDGIKLGGARWVYDKAERVWKVCDSPLGGCQGDKGRFFFLEYEPGDLLDHLVETYAGPHDWLNSHYWYNEFGNGINHTGFAKFFGETLNVVNVVVATPFAATSVVPSAAYQNIISVTNEQSGSKNR